jgi:RNA polymerase sigma-70 factor (ECF subfamily)
LIGDRALADEAVQAAWLDIVRGLASLRDERAFPAWAYRITTRKASAGIGEATQRGRAEQWACQAADAEAAAEHPSGAAVDKAALRRAVSKLPPGHRAAVALHYFEELSIAETAVALGIPAGTVKTRLMHARAKLRAALEGENHA